MSRHLAIPAALALFLSGCGGGGATSVSVLDTETSRELTGAAPPAESQEDVSARVPGIASRSDSLVISTAYVDTSHENLPNFRLTARCVGTRCDLSSSSLGHVATIRLSDLEFTSDTNTGDLGTRQGVTAFSFAGQSLTGLGAWLQHSGFQVSQERETIDEVTIKVRTGLVGGDLTGTQPTGNATWRGIMFGMTATGAGRGERLQGDATLRYDLAASNLDISFDGIQNLDRRRAHSTATVRFDDVPVSSDGTFEAGLTGNRVQGGFYGPEHAEATGVFDQANIVGAFGATK